MFQYLQETLEVEEGPEFGPELDIREDPRLVVNPIKDVFGIPKLYTVYSCETSTSRCFTR